MASDNQLRARVPDRQIESIRDLSKEREITETDAERVVVREGLASLGYLEEPTDPAGLLVDYANKSGMTLGLAGLILIGWGLLGAPLFRFLGFGLVLLGFALIGGAEYGVQIGDRLRDETEAER